MAGEGAVAVKGLWELQRAFATYEEDLVGDFVMELEEAADPVRKLVTQYILGGGGGFDAMAGVAKKPENWADMRVGVSKRETLVWVAPLWRSNKGTSQGQTLALHYRFRMEAAVEDKSREIEDRVGDMLDRLGKDWGQQLAA